MCKNCIRSWTCTCTLFLFLFIDKEMDKDMAVPAYNFLFNCRNTQPSVSVPEVGKVSMPKLSGSRPRQRSPAFFVPLTDCGDGCRNADDGVRFLDADAQLKIFVKGDFAQACKTVVRSRNYLFRLPLRLRLRL
jgi:hypothetical protein